MRYKHPVSKPLDPSEHNTLRDEPIDVSVHATTLRRHAAFVIVLVALCSAGTWLGSHFLPVSYQAESTLIVLAGDGVTGGSTDTQWVNRELITLQTLATTSSVLRPAAEDVGLDLETMRERISTQVEGQSAVIRVTADAPTREEARDSANSVVTALVEQRRLSERERIQEAISVISQEIEILGATPGNAEDQQRAGLLQRRTDLAISAATAGNYLDVADEAELPAEPASPRPLLNAAVAFVGSLVLAVLLALTLARVRARQMARPAAHGDPDEVVREQDLEQQGTPADDMPGQAKGESTDRTAQGAETHDPHAESRTSVGSKALD
jgi:capsular polysaccharide biosynthesis protein